MNNHVDPGWFVPNGTGELIYEEWIEEHRARYRWVNGHCAIELVTHPQGLFLDHAPSLTEGKRKARKLVRDFEKNSP